MSKKSKSIPNPYARKIPLPCRVNTDEMKQILARAHKYTGGNVSEFVRDAVLNWKPESKKKAP